MAGSGAFPKVSGDTVFANDYNTLRNLLIPIIGVGSGTSGYGAATPMESSGVIQDDTIFGLSWTRLKNDALIARKHQLGTGTAYNNLVTSFATVTTKLTSGEGEIGIADVNLFKTTIDAAVTNKDTAAANQLTRIITGATRTYTSSWNGAIAQETIVTFASADDARNFFNAGGYLVLELDSENLAASGTAPNSRSKDQDWQSILADADNSTYDAGDYRSGTANVVIRSETYGSSYGQNYFKAWGHRTSTTTIKITALFDDASAIEGERGVAGSGDVYDEVVTLDITSAVNYYKSFDAIVSPTPSTVVASAFSVVRTDTQVAPIGSGFGGNVGVPVPGASAVVTRGATNVNEGNNITFYVAGTNTPNGTYYFTVTNSGDFVAGSGSFTITSNSGSFQVTPSSDSTTEGAETFTASVRTGSAGGSVIGTSASVTINDTSQAGAGVVESISGIGATFTIGSVLTYTVTGTPNTQATYSWTGVKPDGSNYTGLATNTFTLSAAGTAGASGVFLSGPGTFTFTVTFAATGTVRSATTQSLINATWTTLAVTSLDILNAASTTGQRGATLQNNTGYGGLNYVATGPYTATAYGNASSGTLGVYQNVQIRIANPHSAGTATVTLTQTNQAETVLTLAIPAHVTYGFTELQAEYGLTGTQIAIGQGVIYPLYASRDAYSVAGSTRYGLYRNPEVDGFVYWLGLLDTFGQTSTTVPTEDLKVSFFAGASLTTQDGTRMLTPSTSYITGTGYDKFEDRGTV